MAVVTPFARHRAGPAFWRTQHLRMQLRALDRAWSRHLLLLRRPALPAARRGLRDHLPGARLIVLFSQPSSASGRRARAGLRWSSGSSASWSCCGRDSQRAAPGRAAARSAPRLSTRCTRSSRARSPATASTRRSSTARSSAPCCSRPWRCRGASTRAPSARYMDAGLVLLLGLLAGTAHWLHHRAFLAAPASLLTPFTYLQLVWATLMGYLVFHHLPEADGARRWRSSSRSGVAPRARRTPARAARAQLPAEISATAMQLKYRYTPARRRGDTPPSIYKPPGSKP